MSSKNFLIAFLMLTACTRIRASKALSHAPALSYPSHQSLCLVANQTSTDALLSTYQSPLPLHTIFSTNAKRPLPSLHLKVVHTHWLKLFSFQLFRIVSFYKSLHYAPYFLQTLHNICIISRPKSLQSPINTGLIYPNSSLSGTTIHL